jgi:hypothetical protein
MANIATKPQPVALFEEQRESLLQWQAETATMDELQQQLMDHLRACDVVLSSGPGGFVRLDLQDKLTLQVPIHVSLNLNLIPRIASSINLVKSTQFGPKLSIDIVVILWTGGRMKSAMS